MSKKYQPLLITHYMSTWVTITEAVEITTKAIKQKMLTCVSEKYTSLGTEEITAQSLKDIFKTVPPLTAYDSDLTGQAVSEIQLKRNGTISLVLINGQRIEKEKSA